MFGVFATNGRQWSLTWRIHQRYTCNVTNLAPTSRGDTIYAAKFSVPEKKPNIMKLCVVMATVLERLAVQLVVVLLVTAATAQTQKIDPTKAAQLILAFFFGK